MLYDFFETAAEVSNDIEAKLYCGGEVNSGRPTAIHARARAGGTHTAVALPLYTHTAVALPLYTHTAVALPLYTRNTHALRAAGAQQVYA